MGYSRDTFYRYKEAVNEGGVDALLEENRRKPNQKNRVDPTVEVAVVAHALEEPAHGQTRASNELRRKGVFVSPTGVRGIWLRHDLGCFKDRLRALEEHVAKTGEVLTESQYKHWSASNRKKKRTGRSKLNIQGISDPRTPITLAPLRVLGESTNRLTLTHTARLLTANCIRARHR